MRKCIRIALLIALFIIIAIAVYIVQFNPMGYRMTAPLRGFTEVAPNVFVHDGYTNSTDNVVGIVNEANARVREFFGELKSTPVVIVCDDPQTLAKLGGDHDTMTAVILRVYSYISVSSEFLNVDVVAHELTHAEVHARIYAGRLGYGSLVPTWFDEGVALQNDYRERYNEDAWNEATDFGKNVVDLTDLNTAAKFYAGTTEDRRYRYIVSKHELGSWIERNGLEALFALLDKVNQGTDFDEL